ncbi:hypothetical protein E2C01_001338 [Portunus trituberculatus]|uniref:Uncharacterized protein n=1 Tax=Portunus trituberculatus TaxID=210409 RepID=A0A5B7CJ52_PORTR|nr:hypothetical protein [Portunus trituberculatus]
MKRTPPKGKGHMREPRLCRTQEEPPHRVTEKDTKIHPSPRSRTTPLPRQYGGQPRLFTNYLETSHNRRVGVFLVFLNLKKVPAVSTHPHHRHLLLPVTATHPLPPSSLHAFHGQTHLPS